MVIIKTTKQIEGVRQACKIVAHVHERVRRKLEVGLSTYQVDNVVRHTLRDLGAKSAFFKYSQAGKKGFPGFACISVNDEIVHGIRSHNRLLQNGDVITIDVGAVYNGFYGDAAFTAIVGNADDEKTQLVERTREALFSAIKLTKPGVYLFDISKCIADEAEKHGYGVVTGYFGHGVGLRLHEPPQIPNYIPKPGTIFNHKLQSGMIITYEPMFTLGQGTTRELEDDWTVVTADGSTAAHWEHTILVTETGCEVLTE